MSKIGIRCTLLRTSLLLAMGVALPLQALCAASGAVPETSSAGIRVFPNAAPPDSTLFTTYSFYSGYTDISWVVCGSTKQSEGCYGAGNLSPFGHVGALIEGNEVVNALSAVRSINVQNNTVTRKVFVVDDNNGEESQVRLFVYTKTDIVDSDYDTTTFTLDGSVALPLTGGAGVKTFIAGDADYLFIGTSRSGSVRVNKADLTVDELGGFSGSDPVYVSSITSNKYGYIAVTYGGGTNGSGFYLYNPDGSSSEDGGGSDFLVDTMNGVSTTNIESAAAAPNLAARMKIKFKKPVQQNSAGN